MRRLFALLCALLVVAACARGGSDDQAADDDDRRTSRTTLEASDSTTSSSSSSTSSSTTTTAEPVVTTTPPLPASPSCPAIPARVAPRDDRSRYVLDVDVRLAENAVAGHSDIHFTPDIATDKLVLRLWANSPRTARLGAKLEVTSATLGGAPAPMQQPNATTVVVPLSPALDAGESVQLGVDWRLTLPGAVEDRISRSGDTVRLGSFHPILAWEPGVGWAEAPPTALFAESSVSAPADFAMTVKVPAGLQVLASGELDDAGRWTSSAVPDVALSVGRFRLASGTARSGAPVAVTVGVAEGINESPQTYLNKVIRSIEQFSQRFGAYPWPSYSLAITPVLRGGIEYPMHVLQGPGTIGRTTSHEVGHMWFYGLVHTHQGRDPWLDEGLASYAEATFEGTLGEFRTRSVPSPGRGRMGEPMTYWDNHPDSYYRSVYVQGTQAIAAMGDTASIDCALRLYVARNSFRVAQTSHLLDSLDDVFPHARDTLSRFGARV